MSSASGISSSTRLRSRTFQPIFSRIALHWAKSFQQNGGFIIAELLANKRFPLKSRLAFSDMRIIVVKKKVCPDKHRAHENHYSIFLRKKLFAYLHDWSRANNIQQIHLFSRRKSNGHIITKVSNCHPDSFPYFTTNL